MEKFVESQNDNGEEINIDIKKFFFKYLSYWRWFVLSVIAFLILGIGYLFFTTPVYNIKASILIKDDSKMGMGGKTSSMLEELDMFSSKKVVENEIEILHSYTLLEQVTKELNLQVKYLVKKGLRKKEIYDSVPIRVEVISSTEELYKKSLVFSFENNKLHINEKVYPESAIITESFGSIRVIVYDSLLEYWDKEKPIEVKISSFEGTVESLRTGVDVSTSAKGSSVITLSMLSSIPQKGQDILNELIKCYDSASIADKNNLAGITLKFIDGRLKLLSIDLQGAEQKVEDYKSKEGITDISAESELFLKTVQQNDLEQTKVDIQLEALRNVESYVLKNADKGGTAPATLGISDPTLLSLIENLAKIEAERIRTLSNTQPGNPLVQAMDNQISQIKHSIIDNIQVMRRSLEVARNKYKTENSRLEFMIQKVPQKERKLLDIVRQQEIYNQLYVYLLTKKEETAISYAATVSDSRLVDAARSSLTPVKPVKKLILLIFGLLGLILPVGILFIKDLFDDKVSSKEEVEKKILAPIIGEISLLEQSAKIIVVGKNRSKHAEQIRTLRTNLEFMQAGGGIKTILITSSISGEGKSFLTANLGTAFAALDKKVVVLGFDLRKPGLHKVFGIDNDEGLSNYLAGQADISQIIRKVESIEGLDVITCGHIPPNPQELLQGSTLPQLFEELKKMYDYVIVDTPPVGLVSDAIILDKYAEVSIFVVRQNYTPKDRIKAINELFNAKKMNNFGIVVNGIKEEKWHGYYASYGSEKYYGKYYDDDTKKKRSRFRKNYQE